MDKLALCGVCYRYIKKRNKNDSYADHGELCSGGKYGMFFDWRTLVYG